MEHEESLDAGTLASEEEIIATEGAYSEEDDDTLDVGTSEEDDEEEVIEQPQQQKKQKGVAKLLAEKNALKSENEQLKLSNAMASLKLKYGEFDENAVKSVMVQHPTLSIDQAYALHERTAPTQEKEPASFNSMVGMPAKSTDSSTVTDAQLLAMDQGQYNIAMEKIKAGKLRHV